MFFYIVYNKVFFLIKDIFIEDLYMSSRKYSDEVFYMIENGEMLIKEMYIYRIMKVFEELGNFIIEKDV